MTRRRVPAPPDHHQPPGERLDEVRRALPDHRREVLDARIERWGPDLHDALALVHGPDRATDVAARLVAAAAQGYADRPDDLHTLDLRRSLAPDWFQQPGVVGYAAYADRLGGTLAGVGEHTDHLRDLGVTYLHLMPLLAPRPGADDGGYAVADHREVRPDLGTTADLRDLARRLRGEGISLCLDLVVNHVAREHAWARAARAGDRRYRDYFLIYPDRTEPDRWEATLPEVFPDFAPGSFTWDDEVAGWVWTTFNGYQWDLDWSNPDVLVEFADIVCFLANAGAEVLRLDAIAFLWKRLGTDCQNQPEVHALTQALRCVARIACPAVVFKAEAIVGPRDLLAYLGQGRHHGRISDLAYHNALMVHLWSMLASGDTALASHALQQLPAPPSSTAWITYARCHDDIGWAIGDEDAAAVGRSGAAHRRFLADFHDGTSPGSWARGLAFQHNPATGDKRTSGSLASLAGVEAGDPHGPDRVVLAHAVVAGWGGVPVIWMGDEVGLLNDPAWDQDPAHAADNRWAHRPPMPWRPDGSLPDPHHLLPRVRAVLAARRGLPHLHAATPAEVLDPPAPGVLGVVRRHPLGPMVGLYNMTSEQRHVPWSVLHAAGLGHGVAVIDHLSSRSSTSGPAEVRSEGDAVVLAGYTAAWLTDDR